MKIAALMFLVAMCLAVKSQSVNEVRLPIDASHSVISFSVGFAGGVTSIDGRFNEFEGVIGFKNERDPTSLFAEVKLKVASINTGDKQRDEDLQSEVFFNSKKYPEIIFISESISTKADGYMVSGTFQMNGISKKLDIPFKFTHPGSVVWVFGEPRIAAKANLVLDRSEFGIPKRGWDNVIPNLGSMALSKEVNISITIQGVGPGLGELIIKTIDEKGVAIAINQYNSLERENLGKETYGFGANALLGISMQLIQKQKLNEAVEISKFNISKHPDSHISFYALALALEKTGDKKEAIQNLEKAIKLKPDFQRAKDHLEKLKNS